MNEYICIEIPGVTMFYGMVLWLSVFGSASISILAATLTKLLRVYGYTLKHLGHLPFSLISCIAYVSMLSEQNYESTKSV
jgi:hypothetical protein